MCIIYFISLDAPYIKCIAIAIYIYLYIIFYIIYIVYV